MDQKNDTPIEDPQDQRAGSGGLDLGSLLGMLAGGGSGQPAPSQPASGGMDLGSLLGMLGGESQGASAAPQTGSGGVEILGSMMNDTPAPTQTSGYTPPRPGASQSSTAKPKPAKPKPATPKPTKPKPKPAAAQPTSAAQPGVDMDLGSLLSALGGGQQAAAPHTSSGQSTAYTSGGGYTPPAPSASSSAGSGMPTGGSMDLGSLLGALGGGQPAASQPSAPSGGLDLGSLLGALGGGQPAASQPNAPSGGLDLGSLLGALGGGEQATPSQSSSGGSGLGALLGMLGGGGGSPLGLLGGGGGSPFDALAQPLAKKLGIPTQLASILLMLLANSLLNKASNRAGTVDRQGAADVSQVMAMMNRGEANSAALQHNSLVRSMSQQTGLDHQTTAQSIVEMMEMLGGQQGLDDLLASQGD